MREIKFILLEDNTYLHVLPDRDTKPHAFIPEGTVLTPQTKLKIEGLHCPCHPQIVSMEGGRMLDKLKIVHNSFEQMMQPKINII